MNYIQQHNLVNTTINSNYYKFFIVLSKNRIIEIEQKIANLAKKDRIIYIQEEFEKAWKQLGSKLISRR